MGYPIKPKLGKLIWMKPPIHPKSLEDPKNLWMKSLIQSKSLEDPKAPFQFSNEKVPQTPIYDSNLVFQREYIEEAISSDEDLVDT